MTLLPWVVCPLTEELEEARNTIYFGSSYYVFRGFLPRDSVDALRDFWLRPGLEFFFSDKIANRDVSISSPPYWIPGVVSEDRTYCVGLWNSPLDVVMHEVAHAVLLLRNRVSLSHSLEGFVDLKKRASQYRLSRTVSSGEVVKRHADFMDEFRADPTGPHDFDPMRLQATLMLSNKGEDFQAGGFYFDSAGSEFFISEELRAGDLLLWRYNLPHGVKDVAVGPTGVGFLRAIFPTFVWP